MTAPKKKKIYTLNDIPADVLKYGVANYLSVDDLSRMTKTHKRGLCLFSPALTGWKQRLLPKLLLLLQYTVKGRQSDVEKLLKNFPVLLTLRGNVIDYSGRRFQHITPFEYALWAFDKHMWEKMIHALPKDNEGHKIKQSLQKQYHNLIQGGGRIQYTFDKRTYQEQHYDFALKDKLNEHVENFCKYTLDECTRHWCEGVGGAQRMVPVHIANEYCCHEQNFSSILSFNEPHLAQTMDIYKHPNPISWFPLNNDNSGLGFDFAIFRSHHFMATAEKTLLQANPVQWEAQQLAEDDLAAITALYEKRVKALDELDATFSRELENPPPTINPIPR